MRKIHYTELEFIFHSLKLLIVVRTIRGRIVAREMQKKPFGTLLEEFEIYFQ